jgi:hypothetical protein
MNYAGASETIDSLGSKWMDQKSKVKKQAQNRSNFGDFPSPSTASDKEF